MNKMGKVEQAVREGFDYWEVWVLRPGGPEFQAWDGFDSEEAKTVFEVLKTGNVKQVNLYVNGNIERVYKRP